MEKDVKTDENKPVFESKSVFMRRLRAYVKYCMNGRDGKNTPLLANEAGFCRFCSITRNDFRKLKKYFPHEYDITLSTFIDEAINTKSGNSSQTIAFLSESIDDKEEGGFNILCPHDTYEDGQ